MRFTFKTLKQFLFTVAILFLLLSMEACSQAPKKDDPNWSKNVYYITLVYTDTTLTAVYDTTGGKSVKKYQQNLVNQTTLVPIRHNLKTGDLILDPRYLKITKIPTREEVMAADAKK